MARGWVTNWVYSSRLNMRWSYIWVTVGLEREQLALESVSHDVMPARFGARWKRHLPKEQSRDCSWRVWTTEPKAENRCCWKMNVFLLELMLMLDAFPLIVCLLVEGKLPIMTVGAFLLMQWWHHVGSQMDGTKLTVCCWIVLCPALNHWST